MIEEFSLINHTKNLRTKHKDKINIFDVSNVVYKNKCKDCDKHYIGYTTKCFKIKLYHYKISLIQK